MSPTNKPSNATAPTQFIQASTRDMPTAASAQAMRARCSAYSISQDAQESGRNSENAATGVRGIDGNHQRAGVVSSCQLF